MTSPGREDRWRRAILAEIAKGTLTEQAINYYLDRWFSALDPDWVLKGCQYAAKAGPSIDAENIYRRIITAQQEKATAS